MGIRCWDAFIPYVNPFCCNFWISFRIFTIDGSILLLKWSSIVDNNYLLIIEACFLPELYVAYRKYIQLSDTDSLFYRSNNMYTNSLCYQQLFSSLTIASTSNHIHTNKWKFLWNRAINVRNKLTNWVYGIRLLCWFYQSLAENCLTHHYSEEWIPIWSLHSNFLENRYKITMIVSLYEIVAPRHCENCFSRRS